MAMSSNSPSKPQKKIKKKVTVKKETSDPPPTTTTVTEGVLVKGETLDLFPLDSVMAMSSNSLSKPQKKIKKKVTVKKETSDSPSSIPATTTTTEGVSVKGETLDLLPLDSVMAMSSNSPSKPQKKIKKKKKTTSDSSSVPVTTTATNTEGVSVKCETLDLLPLNSCHQCRQRKAGFMAMCKNQRANINRPCPIKFCQPCLLNRYGERVDEVAVVEDWKCPKCRDICNCSLCMKKKGHRPTGILTHTAKTTGFSSVSELLNVRGHEYLVPEEVVKDVGTSAEALVALSQDTSGGSPSKVGKNCCYENLNARIDPSAPEGGVKKTSKKKRKTVGENENNGNIVQGSKKKSVKLENNTTNNSNAPKESTLNPSENEAIDGVDDKSISGTKSSKKSRVSKKHKQIPSKEEETATAEDGATQVALDDKPISDTKSSKKSRISKKHRQIPIKEEETARAEGDATQVALDIKVPVDSDNMKVHNDLHVGDDQPKLKRRHKAMEHTIGLCNSAPEVEISWPQGTTLTTVAGIDLPCEDVGHALQFLEFCKAFGKVFDLRKGYAESLLRELTRDGSRRRRQYSPIIQFQVQLLSFIQKDAGEESPLSSTSSDNSWLQALEKCISQSCCKIEELPSNCFEKSGNGYDQLTPSKKLRILNFLCDEALGTDDLRDWIDEENTKFMEEEKEARQKVFAAREKEKCFKKQIQEETLKRILLKNDSPLLQEIDDHVSSLKVEAAEAHTEVLQAIGMLHQKKQRPDAVRTDPTILNGNGQVVWSLRSYSSSQDVLLQDIGSWDSVTPEDKWFTYAIEQKQAVENCISSLRRKRLRAPIGPNVGAPEASEGSVKHESSDDQSSPSEDN